MARVKYTLYEADIPTQWYNALADLPGEPAPPLDPETLEPMAPEDLMQMIPRAVVEQEAVQSRHQLPTEGRPRPDDADLGADVLPSPMEETRAG